MDCCATLSDDLLILENSRIRREYRWNGGQLISRAMTDVASSHRWELSGDTPDCQFPNEEPCESEGTLEVTEREDTPITPAHLRVEVTCRIRELEVRRRFRLYPDCPAIACDFFLRGRTDVSWREEAPAAGDLGNLERFVRARHWTSLGPIIERLTMKRRHLRVEGVQFSDVTDRRNNLVAAREVVPYLHPTCLSGNLLIARDLIKGAAFFILKEAACPDVQLAWPGCDFACTNSEVAALGIGVDSEDLSEEEWTRGYGFVTGVAAEDELAVLQALRQYQGNVRKHKPGRDHMIMLNTWGDRGQDTKISEAFCLAELEAGARLGVTHFQIDDGWQQGRSSNSALGGGSLESIWDREDYWAPHPERFPNGLRPVVQRAQELGIELCLWFNPSKDNSYEHWCDDADTLIQLHKQHGIRTFKIDGVDITDKRGEVRLRAMFDQVQRAANLEAVFNLDVTAGHRYGYHYFNEYGNLFVENRYTDWSNYYPHWTLRNLWMLSRYVPPQSLQIEFLNRWRNPDKYSEDDPLAPARVPFDYCFAVAMMAQPLAWFEGTGLPEEAFEVASLIKTYREHQEQIHAGQTFPIGEEPSGIGWTGFQSCRTDGGYFLVYRECNERKAAHLATWGLAGQSVVCRHVLGHGEDFATHVDSEGRLEFGLPEPFTFALYEYRVRKE